MCRSGVVLAHFLSVGYVPIVAAGGASIITIHDLIHLRFPDYFKAKVGPYYGDRRAARMFARKTRHYG